MSVSDATRAILNADPGLSRFDPLPRIIYHDDFNRGLRGWVELIGNYEDSLDSMLPQFADMRPPMLSSGTHWDTGTHGAMQGTYALKLATRPRAGDISVSIKRVTWRHRGAGPPGGLLHLQAGGERAPTVAQRCALRRRVVRSPG